MEKKINKIFKIISKICLYLAYFLKIKTLHYNAGSRICLSLANYAYLIEKFKIKGDWVEPFLLEIYQLVDKYDHDVKTKFENYLKDMLESLPSHLNEESVRKELNLGGCPRMKF